MTILTFLVSSAGSESSSDGGSALSFLLLPLMLLAMYFLIIRPNSKKRKDAVKLQSALGVGDEVITTAGIIGTITGEDGPTRFWLEIDSDVQVRIARGGIAGRLEADELGAATDDAKADDEAEADVDADADSDADESAERDS